MKTGLSQKLVRLPAGGGRRRKRTAPAQCLDFGSRAPQFRLRAGRSIAEEALRHRHGLSAKGAKPASSGIRCEGERKGANYRERMAERPSAESPHWPSTKRHAGLEQAGDDCEWRSTPLSQEDRQKLPEQPHGTRYRWRDPGSGPSGRMFRAQGRALPRGAAKPERAGSTFGP
jgi:hypothetical protein